MIQALARVAAAAPSADNSQPWRLEWDGTCMAVTCGPPRPPSPFGAMSHAAIASLGAIVENISGYLRFAERSHEVEWVDPGEAGAPKVRVRIPQFVPDDRPPAWGDGTNRHTNRFPFTTAEVPTQVVEQAGKMWESGARCVMLRGNAAIEPLANVVRTCSEARFCNRELHEWLIGSLRFSRAEAARGDGLDIETLYLPPGGRTFLRLTSDWRVTRLLNRLGAYKLSAATETALLRKGPILLCIVGQSEPRETLAAGRLLERVWIDLNARGLAVHPYYVVTDQQLRWKDGRLPRGWDEPIAAAISGLPGILDLDRQEMLHMILRVGWPTRTPPRSRRLPIEALFRDLTRRQFNPGPAIPAVAS